MCISTRFFVRLFNADNAFVVCWVAAHILSLVLTFMLA